MIDDVVDFYQPLAEIKGIPLTFKASEKISTEGDALLLAQAIGNLIDNALKFAHGKVWIGLAFLPDTFRISITVSDDGIGITDEDKPRVVERFYRSHASHGTEGVGLGLSLVAAVARLHGGSFEIKDANPGVHATLLIQSCGTKRAA
jgi:signal transduction histidine kinase